MHIRSDFTIYYHTIVGQESLPIGCLTFKCKLLHSVANNNLSAVHKMYFTFRILYKRPKFCTLNKSNSPTVIISIFGKYFKL